MVVKHTVKADVYVGGKVVIEHTPRARWQPVPPGRITRGRPRLLWHPDPVRQPRKRCRACTVRLTVNGATQAADPLTPGDGVAEDPGSGGEADEVVAAPENDVRYSGSATTAVTGRRQSVQRLDHAQPGGDRRVLSLGSAATRAHADRDTWTQEKR